MKTFDLARVIAVTGCASVTSVVLDPAQISVNFVTIILDRLGTFETHEIYFIFDNFEKSGDDFLFTVVIVVGPHKIL